MKGDLTDWRRDLRPNWPILYVRKDEGEVAYCPVGPELPGGRALMAVDRYGGRHLLVPVPVGGRVDPDRRSAHVRLDGRALEMAGRRTLFLDVACTSGDLFGAFDDLLAAMLEGVAASPERAIDACESVWQNWRRLFQSRPELLSETALRGLIAELAILERVLTVRSAVRLADVWTGPDHAPHDFRLGSSALEVKALGPRGSTVQVHGLGQLEEPPSGRLLLVLVRLAADEEGRTLPELVAAIRGLAEDESGLSLQLAKAGYFDDHADAYADRGFSVGQICALPIGPGFPRITVSSLSAAVPPEIDRVAYDLDLSARLADSMQADELDGFIERGVLG